MSDKSEVISARLNPQFDEEAKALELFHHWKDNGYTPREIITSALLKAGNQAPTMFRERGQRAASQSMGDLLQELRNSLLGDIKSVIQEMVRTNPQEVQTMVNKAVDNGGEIELDDEFIQNAMQSLRPTYRKMRGDE